VLPHVDTKGRTTQIRTLPLELERCRTSEITESARLNDSSSKIGKMQTDADWRAALREVGQDEGMVLIFGRPFMGWAEVVVAVTVLPIQKDWAREVETREEGDREVRRMLGMLLRSYFNGKKVWSEFLRARG